MHHSNKGGILKAFTTHMPRTQIKDCYVIKIS